MEQQQELTSSADGLVLQQKPSTSSAQLLEALAAISPEKRRSSGCSQFAQAARRVLRPGKKRSAKGTDGDGEQRKIAISSRVSAVRTASTISDILPANRALAHAIVSSTIFDVLMCGFIVANAVVIGLEQSFRLQKLDITVFDYCEHAFLVVYIAELGLRFYALRLECFNNNWVRFDCVITLVGVVSTWVLFPLVGDSEHLASLLVLRTGRLFRLARTMRLVHRFREIWMLVQGLVNSLSRLFHTSVLFMILLYVFGCMSIELIPLAYQEKEELLSDSARRVVDVNFSSLPVAMLSLVQFVTLDNVNVIYWPLIEQQFTLAFFFVAVLAVIGIVFMNLVTAIIVNGGLEQATQDKDMLRAVVEEKRKKVLRALKCAFKRADTDHSGNVSREELEDICEDDKALLKDILGLDNLMSIFDSLDVDGIGDIEIDEFVSGIESIVISQTPVEVKRIERLMSSMRKQMGEFQRIQDDLRQAFGKISKTMGHGELRELQRPFPQESADEAARKGEQENGPPDTGNVRGPSPGLPLWMDDLVLQLQERCASELRRAMGEAYNSLVAQVNDVTTARTASPGVGECQNMPTLSSNDIPVETPLVNPIATNWEALPPRQDCPRVDAKRCLGASQHSAAGRGACPDSVRRTSWPARPSTWSANPGTVLETLKVPVFLSPRRSEESMQDKAPSSTRVREQL